MAEEIVFALVFASLSVAAAVKARLRQARLETLRRRRQEILSPVDPDEGLVTRDDVLKSLPDETQAGLDWRAHAAEVPDLAAVRRKIEEIDR